jgi:actin-related protein
MSESIIIDNGTNTIKAGFSDDDMPRVVIPTVLGRPFSNTGQVVKENEDEEEEAMNEQIDIFVGEEALNRGGTLQLLRPITKGEIKDFKTIELIWKHIFYNELLAETKSHSVIMTEAPFTSSDNKKLMAEVLFDKLGVESLYIINTSNLALYANGKTTGTVVDIGYQTTSFVPIYEGFVLHHAVTKFDTGGKDLTDFFCHIIGQRNDNDKCVNEGQKSMINELKEKICEVAEDYDSQVKKCIDSKIVETHTLPDGSKVKITHEKYQCPELLFQPQFYQRDHFGLHEQTFKSIKKCDEDIEKDLFQNVILCGGSSLFLKIRKKFEKELQSLAPTGKTVKVIAPPERKFSSWLGGAILSSMNNFKNAMFVNKKEWMESGANIIYDKFF